jgi:hypothetical protein
MRFLTISDPGYSILTENLIASAGRFGIEVDVYVPSPQHVNANFDCIVVNYPKYPEKCEGFGLAGFNAICNFKLRVVSHIISQNAKYPIFYVDSDAAMVRDPRPWFEKNVTTSVAIQKHLVHPIIKDFYCTGMFYLSRHEPWLSVIFADGEDDSVNDEVRVNKRIREADIPVRSQVASGGSLYARV